MTPRSEPTCDQGFRPDFWTDSVECGLRISELTEPDSGPLTNFQETTVDEDRDRTKSCRASVEGILEVAIPSFFQMRGGETAG